MYVNSNCHINHSHMPQFISHRFPFFTFPQHYTANSTVVTFRHVTFDPEYTKNRFLKLTVSFTFSFLPCRSPTRPVPVTAVLPHKHYPLSLYYHSCCPHPPCYCSSFARCRPLYRSFATAISPPQLSFVCVLMCNIWYRSSLVECSFFLMLSELISPENQYNDTSTSGRSRNWW